MREERGLGRSGLIGFSNLHLDDDEDEAGDEAMRRDRRYDEMEMDCSTRGDKEGAKTAREKRAASRRLHRVEIIYVSDASRIQLTNRKARCRSCRAAWSSSSSSCSRPSPVLGRKIRVCRMPCRLASLLLLRNSFVSPPIKTWLTAQLPKPFLHLRERRSIWRATERSCRRRSPR